MTNFVTASRGDELLFRIDDSVESKPLHTIVTLVSLGMPEAAALCGLTERPSVRPCVAATSSPATPTRRPCASDGADLDEWLISLPAWQA